MVESHDHRDFGGRWRVAAAATAHDSIDHYQALQLQCHLRGGNGDFFVAVVDDLDGPAGALAQFADMRLGQRRVAAVDVAARAGKRPR